MWQTDIPTFQEVVYPQVYPGINLVYSGNQRRLKYTFYLQPRSDPNQIQMIYDGVESLSVDDVTGELIIQTPWGEMRDAAPVAYQVENLPTGIPNTAKSFAEKIGDVTVLIRYTNEFESYLPGYDTDDGFPIEGGQGYIVNVTAGKDVAFTGTVWDDATCNASPLLEGKDSDVAWAFVVAGKLPVELRNAYDLTISVRNVNRNLCRECSLSHSDFRVAFVDLDKNAVVEAGDLVSIEVKDVNGRLVAEGLINVEPKDLANAYKIINPLYNPIPDKTMLWQNYPNPFN